MLHEVLAYNLARKEEKNNLKAFAKKSEYLDRSGYSFVSGRIQDPDENEMQALINDIN